MAGSTIGSSIPPWLVILAPKLVTSLFLFAFGAAVGSFLNVVVYRLPAGRSVVSPPSRCPSCGGMLSWHENLPILGWLLLRGRCRRCREPISPQYPLIELIVGLLFAGTYLLLYLPDQGIWGTGVGGDWWQTGGFARTWPAYLVLMTMLSGLVAATLIDARTFLIPAAITNVMIIGALGGWFLQGLMGSVSVGQPPLPAIGWSMIGLAWGAAAGNLVSLGLLATGVLQRSFADYDDYLSDEDDVLAEYPHARREMIKELAFLLPIALGAGVGWWLASGLAGAEPPGTLASWIGASLLGLFVGGGVVWAVRILGTLAFGREAMGMGDVHLLAAVGASLGWLDPVRVFFIAPFIALAWIAAGRVRSAFGGRMGGELPYGPHLAVATVVVVFARPWIESLQAALFQPPG